MEMKNDAVVFICIKVFNKRTNGEKENSFLHTSNIHPIILLLFQQHSHQITQIA